MTLYDRDGVWWISAVINGQRHRKSTGHRVADPVGKHLARIALYEFEIAMIRLDLGEPEILPWLEVQRKQWRKWRLYIPAGWTWSMITPSWVASHVDKWLAEGKKSSTVHSYVEELIAMINHAHSKGWCQPLRWKKTDVISVKKGKNAKKVALTEEEVEALWATPFDVARYGWSIKEAFIFSLYTGLRWCDLEKLRWQDVADGYVDVVQTKTTDQVRVLLVERIKEMLKTLRPGRNDHRVFYLPHHVTSLEHLKRWVQDAGIAKHVTWHVARVSFATRLCAAGVSIYDVSKLMGHSTVANTEIYARYSAQSLQRAVQSLL